MTNTAKKILMIALIAAMFILAAVLVVQNGAENIAFADNARYDSARHEAVASAGEETELNILGDAYVNMGEEYTYTITGADLIFVEVSGNPNVENSSFDKINGIYYQKVLINEDALPYSTFTITASAPLNDKVTSITVTVKPLYATEIGTTKLTVDSRVLDRVNPSAYPGDLIDVTIENFIIDNTTYTLANSVTYSDFAVSIVTTEYAQAANYNASVKLNQVFTLDNPVVIFNIIVIQPKAPEEYRRLVKTIEVDVYIPVETIEIVGISNCADRGTEASYQVKYNADNVASVKGFKVSLTDLNGNPLPEHNNFSIENNDDVTSFKIKVKKTVPYGSGIKIHVASVDNELVQDEKTLTVNELEASYTLLYSRDYQGNDNPNNGIQLVDYNNKTQLRAGYNANIFLQGNTTGTRYTPNELRAFGVEVDIVHQNKHYFSVDNEGKIFMGKDAPAYTGSARTAYSYTVAISDGMASYSTIQKKVEVYRALGTSAGGSLTLTGANGSAGLNITSDRSKITFAPQGDFSAKAATDFDYSINSLVMKVKKEGSNVYLTLTNLGFSALGLDYTITVTNSSKYNEENIDQAWEKSFEVKRRFVSSIWHMFSLPSALPGEIYYMIDDVDLSDMNWSPGNFAGTLEGKNHSINNMQIQQTSVSSSASYGLFKDITGTGVVKNLNLRNVKIYFNPDHSSVQCNVGAVAGSNYGLIQNVRVYGDIQVHRVNSFTGGIVGKNYAGGTVKNCYNFARLQGNGDMGGIAGQNYAGTWDDGNGIINCTNYADYYFYIIQTRSVGGIVAYNQAAVIGCNNYGVFYLENKDTSTGKAEYDYRCMPKDKSLQPRIGGIIGHNSSRYFDQTGNIGGYAGFTYITGIGYNQLAYFYKHYGQRAGRI